MAEPTNHEQSPARPPMAITGVMPPSLGEARIREAWPTVVGVNHGLAILAKNLIETYVLAPVGFLILLPLWLLKFAPFVCTRYTLTNRRLMVRRGWKPAADPAHQVALADIDEVRFDPAAVDPFYVSGKLEIVSKGQVVLTLDGLPEPEGFRQTILNARSAWAYRPATVAPPPASATPAPVVTSA